MTPRFKYDPVIRWDADAGQKLSIVILDWNQNFNDKINYMNNLYNI